MRLSKLQHPYDKVVSLGAACQVAAQTKRLYLRDATGPFDWFVLEHAPQICEILRTRFANFMLLENLRVVGEENGKWKVEDTANCCLSTQDFPSDVSVEKSYETFYETLWRRIDRFYADIASAQSVLFIRMHAHANDAALLEQCLLELFGDKIALLVVNHTGQDSFTEEETSLTHTCCVRFLQRDGEWEGCSHYWEQALQNVALAMPLLRLEDQTVLAHCHDVEYLSDNQPYRWSTETALFQIRGQKGKVLSFRLFTYEPQYVKLNTVSLTGKRRFVNLRNVDVAPIEIEMPITSNRYRLELVCETPWEADGRTLGVAVMEVRVKNTAAPECV